MIPNDICILKILRLLMCIAVCIINIYISLGSDKCQNFHFGHPMAQLARPCIIVNMVRVLNYYIL